MTIKELSEQVLIKLLDHRKTNEDFTFWLRSKGDRLKEGYWFQGTENYLSIGVLKASSGNLATKSVALNFSINNEDLDGHLLIEFTKNVPQKLKDFYMKLVAALDLKTDGRAFHKSYKSDLGAEAVIDQFLEDYPKILALAKSENLENELLISKSDFERKLNKIQKIKEEVKEAKLNQANQVKSVGMSNKNIILYGPPGTGKTYSTIDKVVEICDAGYEKNNHSHNKLLYDQLIKEGRVVFTTFHQSMSYEDFIEGIKPVKPGDDDKYLKYDIEPGVFKQIANTAKSIKSVQTQKVDWDKVSYYKMSLGGKNRPDIHQWCIENNVIGLGWGGEKDLTAINSNRDLQGWKEYRDAFRAAHSALSEGKSYHIQASFIFNKMKIGDVVVISKGNHIIDAIGIIKGDYFFDDQTPTDMCHFRKVEWITTEMDAAPERFIAKQISMQSIYEFYEVDIIRDTFKALTSEVKVEDKPYVIVIDEINRGNVSAIFGELITLIEDDKRIGQPNELKVTLPYSKEKFGVPSNLHIIGTMNTADRSVEALDTALRRRFTFEEMMPKPELLKEEIDGIKISSLLQKINERIEVLVDRDHTIGHAYFINVKSMPELQVAFKDKIIPLLQEYFYGDYGKIGLVLGEGFVEMDQKEDSIFSSFQYEGREGLSNTSYKLKSFEDIDFKEAIKQLF